MTLEVKVPAPSVDDSPIPVVTEKVSVEKEHVQTASVRLKKVFVEERISVELPIKNEHAKISIVKKNEQVQEELPPRREGSKWIIPVYELVPVTYTQLFLKEEVHVEIETIESIEQIDIPVQKQGVLVERKRSGEKNWQTVEEIFPSDNSAI